MDHADAVTDLIEMERHGSELRARSKSVAETHPDFDGRTCIEPACGDEIPAARLALGKIRCVACQGLKERGLL